MSVFSACGGGASLGSGFGNPAGVSPRDEIALSRPGPNEPLSPVEIAYAKSTAAAVFRRRTSERATTFLPGDAVDGFGICLRSPARTAEGYDYALILLQRRLSSAPISQVDDDTVVFRRQADSAPCRTASLDYASVR
ncbi:hypothetical protein [Jiella marina]|uniref:hypothetical protein n=1 Tax=Jiella sp. LLJ827 TaxID=2917712 RepID=UPI0021019C0F|nr:hypothetical protein [Jiella sp. LLJ827]MCQ0986732.1 hypothetical protein [Jiella sp. LLJ827]